MTRKRRGFSPGNYPARRKAGVGATDAPSIAGVNPYETAVMLWLRVLGKLSPKAPTVEMLLGHDFEKIAIKWWKKEHREKVVRPPRTRVFSTTAFPRMYAHLDAYVEGKPVILEAKARNFKYRSDYGEPGTDEIPRADLVQAMHEMACYGASECWLPVLFGTHEYVEYRIKRSDTLIADLTRYIHYFLRLVDERKPPPISSDEDWALMSALWWKGGEPIAIEADDYFLGLRDEYLQLKEELKPNTERCSEISSMVRHFMGPYQLIADKAGNPVMTAYPDKNGRRVLLFKKPKKEKQKKRTAAKAEVSA